jgi:hypothetical protein
LEFDIDIDSQCQTLLQTMAPNQGKLEALFTSQKELHDRVRN